MQGISSLLIFNQLSIKNFPSIETPLKLRISWKYLQYSFCNGSLWFLLQSIATHVPSVLLWRYSLTFLLTNFCAIHQELFSMLILKKFAKIQIKKHLVVEFFWKSYWLTGYTFAGVESHDKCSPRNHWCIFRYFRK